jgi:hypothetical protein
MSNLSIAQKTALAHVHNGEVKYVHFPLKSSDKPYFLVNSKRVSETRTYSSLMKRGLIRQERPSLRSIPIILTHKGEKAL